MQQNQHFLILLLPILFLPFVISYVPKDLGTATREWKVINNKDPNVIEAATFAVYEYNKQAGTSLILLEVVGGETMVHTGTNYLLLLKVTDGISTGEYWTHVLERLWGQKKLYSFKPIVH